MHSPAAPMLHESLDDLPAVPRRMEDLPAVPRRKGSAPTAVADDDELPSVPRRKDSADPDTDELPSVPRRKQAAQDDDLPAVPRLRRRSGSPQPPKSAPPARASRWGTARGRAARTTEPKPKPVERRRGSARRRTRSPSPPTTAPPTRRLGKRRGRTMKVVEDDDDEDDDEVEPAPAPPPTKMPKLRSKPTRATPKSSSPETSEAKSPTPVPETPVPPTRSASKSRSPSDSQSPSDSSGKAVVEDFSDSGTTPKAKAGSSTRSGRLTSRQRALQGEKVDLEYTKLESPKHKKRAAPKDDWTPAEQKELQRTQRARMRAMVTEKRNREKRAATVDKVLRGVTSKRKKMSLASEERAGRRDERFAKTEIAKGFIRYTSGKNGAVVSVHPDDELPTTLRTGRLVSHYPRPCTRDPKTGKRIFA